MVSDPIILNEKRTTDGKQEILNFVTETTHPGTQRVLDYLKGIISGLPCPRKQEYGGSEQESLTCFLPIDPILLDCFGS